MPLKKLYTTPSKDNYAFLLDILEVNNIYEEHTITTNAESQNDYSVFVNEEDFIAANAILKEQDFESEEYEQDDNFGAIEEPNFDNYDNDELVWIIADTEEEQELRDKAVGELQNRGMSSDEINAAVVKEIKEISAKLELESGDIIFGFLGAVLLGVFAIKEGYSYYSEKREDYITKKQVFAYTESSRKIALAMMVTGIVVGLLELTYIASIYL